MIMLSVLFLVAIVKSASCEFVTGDGIGGTETNIGPFKGSDCVKACMSYPALYNGVTMKADGSAGCWCESGMTGVKDSASSYRTCFFKTRTKCADGIIISRSDGWWGCGHANMYECNLGGGKTDDGSHCCCKTGYTPNKYGKCEVCESQYGSDKDYVIEYAASRSCPSGFTRITNPRDCEAAAAARGGRGIFQKDPGCYQGWVCSCYDNSERVWWKWDRVRMGEICKYTRTSQESALSSGAPPPPVAPASPEAPPAPQELSQESYVASTEADNRKLKAKNEELLTILRSLAD